VSPFAVLPFTVYRFTGKICPVLPFTIYREKLAKNGKNGKKYWRYQPEQIFTIILYYCFSTKKL